MGAYTYSRGALNPGITYVRMYEDQIRSRVEGEYMQGYFSLYRGRRQKMTELLSFFDIPSHTLHYSKIDDP